MAQEYPVFVAPKDADQPIWRYMDLPKLISLLHRQQLFFPNAASLSDPFEGSYPAANIRLRPTWYGEERAAKTSEQLRPEAIRRLDTTPISCWHMNDHESDAMWRLYAYRGYGVAIRSTYRRLTEAFTHPKPIYVGMVTVAPARSRSLHRGHHARSSRLTRP